MCQREYAAGQRRVRESGRGREARALLERARERLRSLDLPDDKIIPFDQDT